MIAWMRHMARLFALCGVLITLGIVLSWAEQRSHPAATAACALSAPVSVLPGIAEASGVALGRSRPPMLWTHNDSGDPVLFALDPSGTIKGHVRVTGATVHDWEDIASGPCPDGNCLYIADIGDNRQGREHVTIYRIPEPRADSASTEPAVALDLTYPDGRHDAEALFVTPDGQLFVLTKRHAPTELYRVPRDVKPGAVSRLELVSRLPLDRVTGASATGDWVVLRNKQMLFFYRAKELLSGSHDYPIAFDLTQLGEPQGEGVALGADGEVYLVGEGNRAGTFARLRCALR
jgi:hypothetical protein